MGFNLVSPPCVKCINEKNGILFRQMPIKYLFVKMVVNTSNHSIISILKYYVSSHGLFLLCKKECDTLRSVIFQDHLKKY